MSTSSHAPLDKGAAASTAEAKPDKAALTPAKPVVVDATRGMTDEELKAHCKKYPNDPICLTGKPPPKDDPPG
jgi:hypothetical protein